MNEVELKITAAQLRQPHGDYALQIAQKMNVSNQFINENTIRALSILPNDSILEIGMANGFFVKDILSLGSSVQYTGCDFSEKMVEEATKLNDLYIKEGRARFYFANADQLPFEKERFDKIFTINTIYFWENNEKTLAEFKRVLKSDGQLTIAVRPKSSMVHYPFVKYGFAMYSKEELSALLEKNGYIVTNIIEEVEPAQEVNGNKVHVETLVINLKPNQKP